MFTPYLNRNMDRRLLSRPAFDSRESLPKFNSKSAPQLKSQSSVAKRVLSAKDQKIKLLQNQLTDAHIHIREINNENRILRSLQKRMDIALQRYEGSEADIPKLINSHQEDLRIWQVKHKRLKEQLKEISQRLKNKESDYDRLHSEHKRLLDLTKNMNLGEKEKLHMEINSLTDRLKKNNETISLLQRKILLENKSNKYRLQTEMLKHKETQMKLQDMMAIMANAENQKKEKIFISNVPSKFKKVNKKQENINHDFSKTLQPKEEFLIENQIVEVCRPMKESNEIFTENLNTSKNSSRIIPNGLQEDDLLEIIKNKLILSDSFHTNNKKTELTETIGDKSFEPYKSKSMNSETYQSELQIPDVKNAALERQISQNSIFDSGGRNSLQMDNIDDLEEKSSQERNMLEDIIDKYCNDVLNSSSAETLVKEHKGKMENIPNHILKKNESSEVNNNSKKKLDEDKKKKLLATLKAIDSGEIDGMTLARKKFNNKDS